MKKSAKISLIISQALFLLILPVIINLVFYLHPLAIPVVWICLTSLTFLIVYYFMGESIILNPYIFRLGFWLYTLALVVLLFFRPGNQDYNNHNLDPFSTILFFFSGHVPFLVAFYNITANIGLFIPFGIYLLMENFRLSKPMLFFIPFVGIWAIEGTQFFTKRGSLDIDDVFLNMLGVMLGYFAFPFVNKLINLKQP